MNFEKFLRTLPVGASETNDFIVPSDFIAKFVEYTTRTFCSKKRRKKNT